MRKRIFITAFIMATLAMLVALPVALAQSGGSSGGAGPTAAELQNPAPGDWPTYGRTLEMTRYSPLDQINGDNVDQLQLAWSRDLGLTAGPIELSPVEYGGVLYVGAPEHVLALDATNGNLIWEHTTKLVKPAILNTMRGGVVVFNGNVYATTGDGRVIALNAKTGKLVWSTQVGKINLSEGFTAEPIFADNKIVVAPSGGDAGGVPGRIIALNPTDGKVAWTFNIIPKPGDPGFDTWDPPSSAQWGGGSAWTPGAYDPQTNTIVWGTGNPTPYFSTGVRSGDNLYTNSKVGLDAATGKLKWYHQIVPADQWDYDQHMTPIITDLNIDGQQQRVTINPTSTGFVNILDTTTGKLLASYNIFQEQTGTLQSVNTGFNADGTPIINQSQRMTKPGDTGLACPFRWTSFDAAAYSPKTGLYYRPNSTLCWQFTAEPLPDDWQPGQSAGGDKTIALPDKFDYIGALSAIDPTTGKIAWQFTYPYDQKVGVVATAGGLVFAPAPDRTFRAFDAKTGKVLWQQILPAVMSSGAITYAVNGTQYVAVPVGGSGEALATHKAGAPAQVTNTGGAMFVFALPKSTQ